MYDPTIARFLQEDTYAGDKNDPLSLNLYIYCYNNPLIYDDPTGHWVDTVLDVLSIGYDIYDICKNPKDIKKWVALGLDIGCAVLPGVTGGGAAYRAVDKVSDAKHLNKLGKMFKGLDKLFDFSSKLNIGKHSSKISKGISTISDVLKSKTSKMTTAIKNKASKIASETVSKVKTNLVDITNKMGASIEKKVNKVSTGLNNISNNLKNFGGPQLSLAGVGTLSNKIESNSTKGKNLMDGIKSYGNRVKDTFKNAIGGTKGVGNPSKLNEVSDIANNYKLDTKQYQNHIVDRHGPNSTFSNKSRFNSNFDIKNGINETLTSPNSLIKPNTNGRGGYIFELSYDNPIGINSKGKGLNTLKVAIDDKGNVITAFPKK